MAKHKVLSTKRLEPSLVKEAEKSGIEIIEQEFISVKPTSNNKLHEEVLELALSGVRYAAFTSANAAIMLDKQMHVGDTFYVLELETFCLSGRTKEAVLQAGCLKPIIVGEARNGEELAKRIIQQEVKEIIFFCGNKRRDELPTMLKKAGIKVHEVVVYETVETPKVSTSEFDGIFFFSPSAVQSFFSANQLKENAVCFAIGQTTADSIKQATQNELLISKEPTQEALLDEVITYFQNSDRC